MSLTIQYSEAKYYAEYDSTLLQSRISERFGTSVTAISREMLYPLYRLFNQTPCSYWDEKVAKQVLSQLENCYSQMPSIRIDDSAFEYFLMGYNAYNQLSDTISDLHDFNLEQTIKARMYQLPTYTSIVEGCISNLLRVIASIVSQVTGKDYITQSKLKNLIEMSDKNGFSELASKINTNIRNAINHGKVTIHKEVAQNKIIFHYVENRKTCILEMAPYEFEDEINTVYDAASGLLLGICLFLSSHNELIDVCRTNKNYLSFALLALELSMPPIHCYSINDTGNQKQLNVEYEVENTDRGYLQYLSMIAAIVVYSKYPDYEQYMINFVSSRMPGSWVRYKREDLIDVCSSHNNISTVWKRVVERKDCLIFPASTENIDMKEVKYFCFPSLSTEKYAIRNIQDASIQDRKRLRAHLFVGDVQNRNELISIIDEALEWLCQVKNPPSPNFEHKHGTMPADAIYLNVYKEDRRKDKNMFPSNTNFVCFVDYNSTGRTTLLHGGVPEKMWMQYHHEVLGQKEIAWRDTTYFTRHVEKVGRNDPCPCGSGKKYKNCCLK